MLEADPVVRDRRAVRRQVLLPRRAGGPAAPARRLVPGGDRGLLLRGPPGAGQDHRRGRVPRAARDRPRAYLPDAGEAELITSGEVVRGRPEPADGRDPGRAVEAPGQDPALADRPAGRGPRHRARQDQGAPRRRRGDAGSTSATTPVYYAGPAKTPEGYASGSFGPTTAGRMDSYVEQFQAAGGSHGDARQGQPLQGGDRGLPDARRLLPRLDRRPGGAAGPGLHQVRVGARVRGARHGGRLEDRGRGLPGVHRRRRQGQRLLHRPLGCGHGADLPGSGCGRRSEVQAEPGYRGHTGPRTVGTCSAPTTEPCSP